MLGNYVSKVIYSQTKPKKMQYDAAMIGEGIDAKTAPTFPVMLLHKLRTNSLHYFEFDCNLKDKHT